MNPPQFGTGTYDIQSGILLSFWFWPRIGNDDDDFDDGFDDDSFGVVTDVVNSLACFNNWFMSIISPSFWCFITLAETVVLMIFSTARLDGTSIFVVETHDFVTIFAADRDTGLIPMSVIVVEVLLLQRFSADNNCEFVAFNSRDDFKPCKPELNVTVCMILSLDRMNCFFVESIALSM